MTRLFTAAEPEVPSLDSMTKTELLAFAVENGIDGVSSQMLKADILAIIKEAIGLA